MRPSARAFRPNAIAGFDLTFSPVKSVSTLWAVAAPAIAKQIEQAHDAAVAEALMFLETHAIFTREGYRRRATGRDPRLIAAVFTHRDSRAGDPDLHTHVAVANKVQTRQRRWLSIYGTVLHEYAVAASEAYNTALAHHLVERQGVRFVDTGRGPGTRGPGDRGRRRDAVRAVAHRRRDIDARTSELVADFTAARGRSPTTKEALAALKQRANLETRAPRREARSEAEQRSTWRAVEIGHEWILAPARLNRQRVVAIVHIPSDVRPAAETTRREP